MFFAGEAARAQQPPGGLTLQGSVKQVGTWSSNPLMVTDGASSLWGSTTSPELVLRNTTPISLWSFGARVDQSYFNQSSFNSTDVHASGDWSRKTERWSIGIKKAVDYDTTRTSELTNYGLKTGGVRHLGLNFNPTVSFRSSPVTTISLSGTAVESQYDDRDFTNYATYTVTPSVTRQFDPLNAGVFSVQARRYRTTRNSATRIDSVSPSLGWQRSFSPTLKANASVGMQTSKQRNYGRVVRDWNWQYVFAGGLSFKGIQDTLDLSAARSQYPYGNGTEALQTSLSLSENHDLNPRLSLKLGASYQLAEYQTNTTGNLESLADVRTGLAFHATPELDVTAEYRYRYETLTNRTKTAQDNAFMVGLVYRPNVWTLAD
jgi:hypothetical protein